MTEAIGSALGAPRDDTRDADTFAADPDSTVLQPAVTLHRLLGSIPGRGFRHHAANPLDADLVVIDETSMVDLSLMAHLLDALRPDTALVLVGDPNQLASVEAGTVLGDIVGAASQPGSPLAGHITELTRIYRFGERSNIAAVAGAIRRGDADETMQVLLSPVERRRPHDPPEPDAPRQLVLSGLDGSTETESDASATDMGTTETDTVGWVPVDDEAAVAAVAERLIDAGVRMVVAARDGDSSLALESASTAKLIAATRRGPFGLYAWTDRIEAGVASRVTDEVGSLRRGERWYIGKPVLITANDPILELANGDVGVVIATGPEFGLRGTEGCRQLRGPGVDGPAPERVVAVRAGGTVRHIPPARLDRVEPWWAMTIHKSQGSEFPEVVVALPEAGSPILTRELLYTALTRARRSVTVIGSEEAVRAAVERPVSRASGLLARLGASDA